MTRRAAAHQLPHRNPLMLCALHGVPAVLRAAHSRAALHVVVVGSVVLQQQRCRCSWPLHRPFALPRVVSGARSRGSPLSRDCYQRTVFGAADRGQPRRLFRRRIRWAGFLGTGVGDEAVTGVARSLGVAGLDQVGAGRANADMSSEKAYKRTRE